MKIPTIEELKEIGVSWRDYVADNNVYEIYKRKLKDLKAGHDWWSVKEDLLRDFVQELHQIQENIIEGISLLHRRVGDGYDQRFKGIVNYTADLMFGYSLAYHATNQSEPQYVENWGENIPSPTNGAFNYGLNVLALLYSSENHTYIDSFAKVDEKLIDEVLIKEFGLSEGQAVNISFNVGELIGRSACGSFLRANLGIIEDTFSNQREKN